MDSDAVAVAALIRYYGRPYPGGDAYVGAHFDSWSSTGDRAGEVDRGPADDLVAVNRSPLARGPAWDLETAIWALPGIGRDEGDEADRP
jgi:hypothetical protein